MTVPEVRTFRLKDGAAYVRAEACRALGSVSLTVEGDEDITPVGAGVFPLWLVRALGPAFADLVLWCADKGVALCPHVQADVARQAALARQAELRDWRDDF